MPIESVGAAVAADPESDTSMPVIPKMVPEIVWPELTLVLLLVLSAAEFAAVPAADAALDEFAPPPPHAARDTQRIGIIAPKSRCGRIIAFAFVARNANGTPSF